MLADYVSGLQRVDAAVELGVGNGTVSLSLSEIANKVQAYDTSIFSIMESRKNILVRRKQNVIRLQLGEGHKGRRVSLVVANPPYVPQPPAFRQDAADLAWNGGPDGSRVTQRMIQVASKRLKEGGHLIMIVSTLQNLAVITRSLDANGFKFRTADKCKSFYEELRVLDCEKIKSASSQGRFRRLRNS
jgi:HemK-related putative methylase